MASRIRPGPHHDWEVRRTVSPRTKFLPSLRPISAISIRTSQALSEEQISRKRKKKAAFIRCTNDLNHFLFSLSLSSVPSNFSNDVVVTVVVSGDCGCGGVFALSFCRGREGRRRTDDILMQNENKHGWPAALRAHSGTRPKNFRKCILALLGPLDK